MTRARGDARAVPVEAAAGDVIFFHYFTLHGAGPNRSVSTGAALRPHGGRDIAFDTGSGGGTLILIHASLPVTGGTELRFRRHFHDRRIPNRENLSTGIEGMRCDHWDSAVLASSWRSGSASLTRPRS